MGFFDKTFNAAEAADSFENFEGDFVMMVTKAEMKPTKTGGEMISISVQVVDGPRKGRFVFENFNVVNSSVTAQAIGRAQLGRLCTALGLPALRHESELCMKPFIGTVAIEEGKNGYPDKMKITGYAPVGTVQVQTSVTAQPVQAAPVQIGNRKPWMKASAAPAAEAASDIPY